MGTSVGDGAKREMDLPGLCRCIAGCSPMPMAVVEGSSHTVRYVNPAFCLLTGRLEIELIGNAFSDVMAGGDECLSLLDRVHRTGQAETHTGQEESASHPFYWSYAMWPILAADGNPFGIVIQILEGTRLHQQAVAMNQALVIGSVRQHELTETAERLNLQLQGEIIEREHAEKELRMVNEDLTHFAFAASHDLREPLRMITSYSQLLVKRYGDQLDSEASVFLSRITESAKRMIELLADLLSFTQAGANEEGSAEFVDFNTVYGKATENLQAAIAESGAIVNSSSLPAVYGHEAHFLQLLQNLIGNAIKYAGQHTPRIVVSAEPLDDEWRFAVADSGMGISPEYHQQIFGVFKRLHGKTIPGTGIGLAICRRVVERYGGRIWVESEQDRGAKFYFTLPMNSNNQRTA